MAKMGRYCKAYPAERLREFGGWSDGAQRLGFNNGMQASGEDNPAEIESDFLYLQENYVVTAGIVIDEQVIFDNVTPEWVEFCKNRLHFEAPNYS
jgi:hypothetical protein